MAEKYFGKYTGIVESNQHDGKLGWIDLRVPAIFEGDEVVTARPALPFGHLFIPEKDRKVWVEFEGGNSELPLWTGVQYLQEDMPGVYDLDPPQKRVIHTPAGHVIIFTDKSGAEGIEIQDGANGHTVKMDKDGISISDGNTNHAVTLESSGITVSMQGGAKVELTSSGVTIDAGPGPITVKGSKIDLQGAASQGMPVLRALVDYGLGNLGAPVPLTGPGNPSVTA